MQARLTAAYAQAIQAAAQAQQEASQRAATAVAIWGAMQPQRVQVQMCGTWGCH
jgi:hypothetical protein